MPFYERQPYIQPLYALVMEVMRGDIRVPKFQRPGTEITWAASQRGDLLDSLYRGFPVGTILLWTTTDQIPTMEVVGGYRVPAVAGQHQGPSRLLLDGHQRLSTLVRILGPGLLQDLRREGVAIEEAPKDEGSEKETWVFDAEAPESSNLSSRERFALLKHSEQPEAHQVPLSLVLNRSDLNRWVRSRAGLGEAQIALIDGVRDRLREYSMPVAVLAANSLEEATESFKRINSSGTPMDDFHMVSALAFKTSFDLQERFAEARQAHLEPVGWHEIEDSDLLRVCAALGNGHPAKMEVAKLAVQLAQRPELLEEAFHGVARAALLLAGIGVHGPAALPYSWQGITLAIEIARRPAAFVQESAVRRWFWLTTYGGVFAGVNSAVYDRASRALSDMFEGRPGEPMNRDVTRTVGEVERFDFRAARAKACVFAMARQQDEGDCNGAAHRAIGLGVASVQTLFSKGQRSRFWHLAIVTPVLGLPQLRGALTRRASGVPEQGDEAILRGLGVGAGVNGSVTEILDARRVRLVDSERQFVERLGLEWA